MIAARPPAILDHLSALSDATRSRILLLLDGHELTVSELCSIVQLPQSTVSRHLKALVDSGWIASRAEGTSHLYTFERDLDPAARDVWGLVRAQVANTPAAAQDQHRLAAALAERRSKSAQFFSSSAGQWDRIRDELFGDGFHLAALAALADEAWTVGDLGCGTGQVSAALAPFVRRIIAVDGEVAMLAAAEERLAGCCNVELRRGELEPLPIADGELDLALFTLVLHLVPEPERALAEAARVLKPGGKLLVIDMLPHDRESYRQQMGHVWLGFAPEQLARLFEEAALEGGKVQPLAPDSKSKGPALFVATARKHPNPDGHPATHVNNHSKGA